MIKVSSKNEASGEERSVNTLRSRVCKITMINIFSLFLCDCAIWKNHSKVMPTFSNYQINCLGLEKNNIA